MGKVCLDPQKYLIDGQEYIYPCGRCAACRDLARMQMAARFLIEKAVHPEYDTFFLALTYDEDHVTQGFDKNHIDHFLQTLRNLTKGFISFRYVLVAEYGDLDLRPHFHFLAHTSGKIPDEGFFRLPNGHLVRKNAFVDSVRQAWNLGFVDDGGTPTAAAVMYTMGYALKEDAFSLEHEEELRAIWKLRRAHQNLPKHLRKLLPYIPFRRFSLRPGIGLDDESLAWVYKYMYNDGKHFRMSIDLGSGFIVPVPGIYLDKFSNGFNDSFGYICKQIRSRRFEYDYQEKLAESIARCDDGTLAYEVRAARVRKRRDDKMQKYLSQSLNIFRNEI